MRRSKGNTEVVAPSSAPMLVTVALAVHDSDSAPGPKYSMILLVPPTTVSRPASFRITSLPEVQPESFPVSFTPTSFGHSSSHGRPTMASTASAPPTPIASMPRPPALGVCESVPMISPPGKA